MEVAVVEKVTSGRQGARSGNKKKKEKVEKEERFQHDEIHPYMTPEFWVNPLNHFWNDPTRTVAFNKAAYEGVVERCRQELKENLIS